MAKLLDRSALLTKEKLEVVKVDLGNDEYVYVRQMTGHERDQFEQSLLKKNRDSKGTVIGYEQATEDFRAKLAVLTLSDEHGNLLLKPTDFGVLSISMSAKRLETIVNKAQEINKISEEDKEALVKNSEADLVGSSSSDSVVN
jgi:hypothetical protein